MPHRRPSRPHLARLAGAALLIAAALAAGTTSASGEANPIAYAVTVEGTQVTTWTAAGAALACPRDDLTVPVDGGGTQTLTLSTAKAVNVSLRPGSSFEGQQLTLRVRGERTGAVTKHWSQLPRPSLRCTDLPSADATAPQTRCGVFGYLLPIALAPGDETVSMEPSANRWSGGTDCAWLAADVDEDGTFPVSGEAFASTALDDEVYTGGLLNLRLPAVKIPGKPNGKALRSAASAEVARTAALGGVTVTMTTKLTFAVTFTPKGAAPKVAILPGRSLGGLRLGGTYAQARAATGDTIGAGTFWQGVTTWAVRGKGLVVYLRAPGKKAGPPGASARITEIATGNRNLTTAKGIGVGSTLAKVKKGLPQGRFVHFKNQTTDWWIIDYPGNRRTAFELSGFAKGHPVRLAAMGCSGGSVRALDFTKAC